MRRISLFTGLFIFLFSFSARAEFFDDSVWYMSPDQWDQTSSSPFDFVSVSDNNDRLEFTSTGSSGGQQDSAAMVSKWSFSFDTDFDVRLRVRYDHATSALDDQAGIGLKFLATDVYGAAQYELSLNAQDKFIQLPNMNLNLPGYNLGEYIAGGSPANEFIYGLSSDSIFHAFYDSVQDRMTLETMNDQGSILIRRYINDVSLKAGEQALHLGLAAWSNGAVFDGSQFFVQDLQITGITAPEPLSGILFVLGAGGLVFFRRKRMSH